jgi:hypothetical protein
MSGTMQGLGATGTGYTNQGGNSLLQQLIMQHMLSGGGTQFTPQAQVGGAYSPQAPMQGLTQVNRAMGGGGVNPVAQGAQMQPQTGGLASAMGGGGGQNLQTVLNAIRQQQAGGGQGGQQPVLSGNQPGGSGLGLWQGLGNLLQGYNWSGSQNPNQAGNVGSAGP